MPISTNVKNLKINELTESQYDTAVQQGIIGANEISIITDAGGGDFVPQLDTMPTADATNLGEIVQYSGTTIPDVDATATGTQTVGSGITDIEVDVATFEGVEQPTGAETVEFTASVVPGHTDYDVQIGDFTISGGDMDALWNFKTGGHPEYYNRYVIANYTSDLDLWGIGPAFDTYLFFVTTSELTQFGITVSGNIQENYWAYFTCIPAETSWSKDGTNVDINAYGVSYSGTVATDDEITVVYTPGTKGITNGYFYQSSAAYSDPSATISQTTGSGLTDLAVNVDTFIATEQPTQSESVVFTAIVTTDSATYTTVTGSFTLVGGNLRGVFENYGWTFGPAEHNGVIVFNNSQDCYIGPEVGTMWFPTNVGVLETYGFQFSETPTNGDVVQYSYTDGSTSWTKGGETVNPADYGVSYSGAPNNGDALTVVYTAPAVTGYLWEQKDVQPAPDVPDVGIEWKTSVDLPGNFQEGSWGVAPIFKITGGLPDGIYEFYYQMKVSGTFSSSTNLLPATVTFKYLVEINNTESTYGTIKGMIFPVIDGEWGGNSSKRLPQDRDSIYTLGYKDGSGNLYLWADSGWWNTDLHGYTNPCPDVSDCFRLSAIKNITTGDTYIAEGSLYNNVQPGELPMSCQLDIDAIQSSPYVPSSMTSSNINIADLPSTQTFICGGINFENGRWVYSTELTVILKCGSDRFNARFQAFVDEYVLTIDEATGIFASTEFVKTTRNLYVKLNLPVGASGVIQTQYALKDMTANIGCHFYAEDITGQSTTQLIPLKIGVTPSVANYIGKILQYEGATDANYTNGYFYKATGNVVSVPGSVTCEEVSSYSKTISLDVDGFINYMMTLGYNKSTIEDWLNNYGEFSYDVDGNTLGWSWYGTFPDTAAALQYFTFSPAATSGERIIWRTYNYVAAHTDVQNASWEEVKTQPGATTPSTMPTLLAANWSSNTQTVTVQGVTASNNVIVSPAPASASDWASAGIICTAQSTNSLTFTCQTVPTNDIVVNVCLLN